MEDPRSRAGSIELAALLLVSVMAVMAVGVFRGGNGTGDRSVVNIVGDPLSATATADGLTLTISVEHPEVVAGDRVRVDIALHNARSTPVPWVSDGCETPFSGAISLPTSAPTTWNGDLDALAHTVDSNGARPQTELRDVRFGGRRDLGCTSQLVPHEIAPDATLRERAVVDLRSNDEPIPNQTVEVSATFAGLLTVALPIRAVDVTSRRTSAARAMDAFVADQRLQDFVGAPDVVGTWHVDLAWWQGGWELWVEPGFAGTQYSLRMRYDPSTQKVIDVRRVVSGQVPGNDPDFEPEPGAESDVLIP